MSILLAPDPTPLLDTLAERQDNRLIALLYAGATDLRAPLEERVDDALVVDVESPRLSRVNFDAVGLVLLDLTPGQLLSRAGRRLVDVLGRLAEESLDLALVGPATATAGAFLQDGVTAGLNLIPGCVVIDDVKAVDDLHGLLAQVSRLDVRVLALDAPVVAGYTVADDTVSVQGDGSVMLIAFVPNAVDDADAGKTARLQILHQPMRRTWPTR